MQLQVLLPTRVEVDEEVAAVTAEGAEGSFTLLERHVDLVSALGPGLLSFRTTGGDETFLAVDVGVLVKCGGDVRVSTSRAVRGALGELRQAVEADFRRLSEHQQQARTASEKIQADFIRRFIELEHRG
ncbi:MAG: F0F1 ATP synthase subunit epsilon [Planctomycetota bacterium]